MDECKLIFGDTILNITPLENGLFALQFKTKNEKDSRNPYIQELVVDIKNQCILTGKITNILLNVLKVGRDE